MSDAMQTTLVGLDGEGDGYVALRIDSSLCKPELAEDLRGILAARWLSETLRVDFETACYGARVYGPLGTFDGVVADRMPNHWRRTAETCGGVPVWKPDGGHPLGKWLVDVANRLLSLPPAEVLGAVLRKHDIVGSKESMPTMLECDDDFAVLLHKPRDKTFKQRGVIVERSLRSLWDSPRS